LVAPPTTKKTVNEAQSIAASGSFRASGRDGIGHQTKRVSREDGVLVQQAQLAGVELMPRAPRGGSDVRVAGGLFEFVMN
jgi:hypothetical protein